MKTHVKKPRYITDQINPENDQASLIEIKKMKKEHQKVKELKQKVDKQLKLLMKKDESLMKECLRKKQSLLKEKQKQKLFIENLQYKQWLREQQQRQAEDLKKETQGFRAKLKNELSNAYEKDFITKSLIASNMKSKIEQWKREKNQKEKKTLQLYQSRFNDTQTRRTQSRQSNLTYFEQKHSRIVKRSMKEVQKQMDLVMKDKQEIDEMERDLLSYRHKSQSRIKMIKKIESDILNVKNETLGLSRTLSVRNSRVSQREKSKDEEEESRKLKNTKQKRGMERRKLSLPLIMYRR